MPRLLTSRPERAERLLCIMSGWWAGRRVVEMAAEHHVSRQLAYRLLASTRCDWRLRRRRRVSRYDTSGRPLPDSEVAKARNIVECRFFTRLTSRQRCVVAWRALGCDMVETARRSGSYPSIVRDVLIGAMWKFENLTWEAEHRSAKSAAADPAFDIGPINIDDLLR